MPDRTRAGAPWPKVTIVTPSFNQGRFLEEAIRSVLLQGYPNLEYIVVDGGSGDESAEVVRKYERWLAWWASEPDGGQADAINKGLRRATGGLLGWLNSDDRLCPDALRRVAGVLVERPEVEFVYGDVQTGWDGSDQCAVRRGEDFHLADSLRTLRMPIPQQGSLWRRSVVEKIGLLDARWHVVLDREFFLRVAAKCSTLYLPGVLAFFRLHPECKSIAQKLQWTIELPLMYREFFERRDLPRELAQLRKQAMSAAYLSCAQLARKCGDQEKVAQFLRAALRCCPGAALRGDMDDFLAPAQRRMVRGIRRFLRGLVGAQR